MFTARTGPGGSKEEPSTMLWRCIDQTHRLPKPRATTSVPGDCLHKHLVGSHQFKSGSAFLHAHCKLDLRVASTSHKHHHSLKESSH